MEYIVRKAEEKDAAEISELISQLIDLNNNETDSEDEGFLSRQIRLLNSDPDYYIIVADMKGQVIGMALGILCHNIYKRLSPFMVVENVVVASSYRKQGIGRKLMRHLEDWAIRNKCGYISLVSQNKRKGAHKFYEALGYEHDDGFQKFLC